MRTFFKGTKIREWLFFSHGQKSHWDIPFKDNMFLIFGKESVGLPKELLETQKENLYQIPLYSDKVRSLNLANSVGIAVYEGLRALR